MSDEMNKYKNEHGYRGLESALFLGYPINGLYGVDYDLACFIAQKINDTFKPELVAKRIIVKADEDGSINYVDNAGGIVKIYFNISYMKICKSIKDKEPLSFKIIIIEAGNIYHQYNVEQIINEDKVMWSTLEIDVSPWCLTDAIVNTKKDPVLVN